MEKLHKNIYVQRDEDWRVGMWTWSSSGNVKLKSWTDFVQYFPSTYYCLWRTKLRPKGPNHPKILLYSVQQMNVYSAPSLLHPFLRYCYYTPLLIYVK